MTSAPADLRRTDRPRTKMLAVLLSFTTLLLALGLGTATSASAKPRQAAGAVSTFTATAQDGTPITGSFAVSRFTQQADGTLAAVGTATVTNTVTGATDSTAVRVPVDLAESSGSCQVLDLVLGPLHLDLLGLVIDLNQIHLTITAQQGPGNLLGNLLCAIAGLLNGPTGLNAILNQIATLLNQLLGALG